MFLEGISTASLPKSTFLLPINELLTKTSIAPLKSTSTCPFDIRSTCHPKMSSTYEYLLRFLAGIYLLGDHPISDFAFDLLRRVFSLAHPQSGANTTTFHHFCCVNGKYSVLSFGLDESNTSHLRHPSIALPYIS